MHLIGKLIIRSKGNI